MADFDRDAVIEQAAQIAWDTGSPLSLKRWNELPKDVRTHSVEREYAADMLPVIAADVLAPIKALHPMLTNQVMWRDSAGDDHIEKRRFCGHCKRVWPCPTAQAIADIEAKAGVV